MSETDTPPSPTQELSIADAIALGVQQHRAGNLDDARTIYRRVLEIVPNHPDALHFLGMLRYHDNDREAGLALIHRALSLAPNYADAHANLGNLLLRRGQLDEAEAHLRKAMELTPLAAPPRIALAVLMRARKRHPEAVTLLQGLLPEHEDNVAVHNGLGNALMELGRPEEAIPHYWRAVELDADLDSSKALIGLALCSLGKLEAAAELYRSWLKQEPDNLVARHMLAAVGGTETPAQADEDYVRQAFDRFADTFDNQLAALAYRAPELIAAAIRQCAPVAPRALDVLDAGCGTGLLAPRISAWCRSLIGVDLSTQMMLRAKDRGYDELVEAELTGYIQTRPRAFDVIASADTLCYFGALEAVTRAAHAALRAGGWLFFSVEHGGEQTTGFRLQHHGRYAHRRDYVEAVLASAGFTEVRIAEDTLRTESAKPVAGLIVAAKKF